MISKRYGKIGIAIAQTLIIAWCAGQPISTVTSSSVQRAIVTQVCAGEDRRPAPYAWILWAIATAHLVYVVYLLFPESFEDLLTHFFANEEKTEPLYIAEAINKPVYQPPRQVVRVQPEENESLFAILQERLSGELPKPLVQVIYLAMLRQCEFKSPEEKALFPQDISIMWGWNESKAIELFRQLQALKYGECYEVEEAIVFVLSELEGVTYNAK